MSTTPESKVHVEAIVMAPIEKVWNLWTSPDAIMEWNTASPDWHTTNATQDLKPGGEFTFRMEAKDGSFGFDFGGVYDVVELHKRIEYTIGDGRKVEISFTEENGAVHIVELFDAENQNPVDLQKAGWQSIMDNFKRYAESH